MIYGATSTLGIQTSKVFAQHGYCLLLVDGNLTKLQASLKEILQVFPHLKSPETIRIVNINVGTEPNSTIVEYKLHRALFQEEAWAKEQLYEDNIEAFKPNAP